MTESGKDGGATRPAMSQSRAARILGVSQSYMNRVLRGHLKSKRLVAQYSHLVAVAAQKEEVQRTRKQVSSGERQNEHEQ